MWFGRYRANKQRGLDELYNHVWKTARATSWIITLVSIYVLFTLHLLGVTLKVVPTLSILFFIHMGSWAITGIVLRFKYYMNE